MKVFKEIIDWISVIIFSFITVCIIIMFIVQPTEVSGQSMEPSLHDGDKIFINKMSRTFKTELQYGDIVVIDSRVSRERKLKDDIFDILKNNIIAINLQKKEREKTYWVKRVIGKAGDKLEYKNNTLLRNNLKVEEPYIKEEMINFPKEGFHIPDNHIFVMGDNRNHSSDSRNIGCVPLDHVLGKLYGK